MQIANEYSELVKSDEIPMRTFSLIEAEYHLTVKMVLKVSNSSLLAERFPIFQRWTG